MNFFFLTENPEHPCKILSAFPEKPWIPAGLVVYHDMLHCGASSGYHGVGVRHR